MTHTALTSTYGEGIADREFEVLGPVRALLEPGRVARAARVNNVAEEEFRREYQQEG